MHINNEEISIKGIRTEFGDAALTLYRIIASEDVIHSDQRLEHQHFQYELHFMSCGTGSFLIQGKEIVLREGELFVIPPGVIHSTFQKTDKDRNVVFDLSLEKIRGEAGPYDYFRAALCEIACTPVPLPSALMQQIPDLYDSFGDSDLRGMILRRAETYDIIAKLFDHINGFRTTDVSSPIPETEDTKVMMLENLVNNNLPVELIAQQMGYSVRHINRLIRKAYGKSLSEIRRDARLASAKRILRMDEGLSVDAVAYRSGFSGADSMRRAFRREVDATPSDYRRTSKQEKEDALP